MFKRLWLRTQSLFGRLFEHVPEPGRFESGSKWSLRGFLAVAPFILPSREYLVYIPKGHSLWRRAPLIVLCHGCRQTPEEFAQGTRITDLADKHGFVILLPRQKDSANAWRCWNWFDTRTMSGAGEAAIVAAQIRSVRRHYRCHRKRVLVAGISAGGALAAVMGVRYPGLVRAVAVHSGLACGAAKAPLSAIAVMQSGPEQDVDALADAARAAAPKQTVRVPLLAVHGLGDAIVSPRNAVALVRQYLHLNGHASTQAAGESSPSSAQRRRRNADDARERPHRSRPRMAQRRPAGRALGRGDGIGPCLERRRPDARVQRRRSPGCDGASRRVCRRCIILNVNRWRGPRRWLFRR
jgi:poly(hydroxyalkanoate) depolymerase family esterase